MPKYADLVAEFIGTSFLLATVIGSGIMAQELAGGNLALALLGNTIPTGAILFVLITIFGPISGAHFNPAVSLVFVLDGQLARARALPYLLAQFLGGLIGVWLAHLMFEQPVFQLATQTRAGAAQGFSELIATFGLILVILLGVRFAKPALPALVGFYITAAYWFTASTSFANPAVTFARGWSDSFAGIAPSNIALFILMQLLGALLAWRVAHLLQETKKPHDSA